MPGPKRKSLAWDVFESPVSGRVKCKQCSDAFKYVGNTTTLLNHIKKKHPTVNLSQPSTFPKTELNENTNSNEVDDNVSSEDESMSIPSSSKVSTMPILKAPEKPTSKLPRQSYIEPATSPLPVITSTPLSISQNVSLRWNTYHTNMQATFPMLLDAEKFVDVTLSCEGQFIKCHKVVLSACSTFFNEILNQNTCQHPIIILRGTKMWEIRALVDFMYRGEIDIAYDKLDALLAAAKEFQIKGLLVGGTSEPLLRMPNAKNDMHEQSDNNHTTMYHSADPHDEEYIPQPLKRFAKRKFKHHLKSPQSTTSANTNFSESHNDNEPITKHPKRHKHNKQNTDNSKTSNTITVGAGDVHIKEDIIYFDDFQFSDNEGQNEVYLDPEYHTQSNASSDNNDDENISDPLSTNRKA